MFARMLDSLLLMSDTPAVLSLLRCRCACFGGRRGHGVTSNIASFFVHSREHLLCTLAVLVSDSSADGCSLRGVGELQRLKNTQTKKKR